MALVPVTKVPVTWMKPGEAVKVKGINMEDHVKRDLYESLTWQIVEAPDPEGRVTLGHEVDDVDSDDDMDPWEDNANERKLIRVSTAASDRYDRSRDRSIESISSMDSIIFRSFKIFGNSSWRRCGSNSPKIIKIRAIQVPRVFLVV